MFCQFCTHTADALVCPEFVAGSIAIKYGYYCKLGWYRKQWKTSDMLESVCFFI